MEMACDLAEYCFFASPQYHDLTICSIDQFHPLVVNWEAKIKYSGQILASPKLNENRYKSLDRNVA